MEEKMKLCDIPNINDSEKKIMARLVKPLTIPQIAAYSGFAYSTVSQLVSVLEAKHYIFRSKSGAGKVLFQINLSKIDL